MGNRPYVGLTTFFHILELYNYNIIDNKMKYSRRKRILEAEIFAILIILGFGYSFAEVRETSNSDVSKNRPYISPTPGKIPIMASSLCLYGTLPTITEIKEFRECGFDVLIQDNKEELYDSLFLMLDGSGIKLIASADALRGPSKKKCVEFMNKYKNNPILGGWEFRDEPQFKDLNMFSDLFKVMTKTDPHHIIHLNVVGEMAKPYVGDNTPNIAAYIDTLQNKFSPGVWSYDVYPIKILDDNGIIIVEYDKFYSDFEAFSRIANKTDRPFWAYCQGVGFRQGRICKPVPKEEYLRFEAFSALAYGAQGIIYWTYRQCRNVPSINFEYLDGPINIKGAKTKVWYAARKVNNEIKKYTDVFLGAKLMGAVHTGKNLYKDTRRMPESGFGPFQDFWSGEIGVLVTHLKNGNEDYFVIVNHSVEKKEKVTFNIKRGKRLRSLTDGKRLVSGGSRKSITLSPGGYTILKEEK